MDYEIEVYSRVFCWIAFESSTKSTYQITLLNPLLNPFVVHYVYLINFMQHKIKIIT